MTHRAPPLVEHFFRHEYGRTVSALARRFGAARIELVEDCVQSAMALALTSWSQRGVPDRPGAWIHRTAQNAVIDRLRHERMAGSKAEQLRPTQPALTSSGFLPKEIADDQLRMLFVCCDEALAEPTQLAMALKILCGFSVKEIALRLFVGEEAVRKRIARGRAQLRSISPELQSPSPTSMGARLESIHRVLYLLFNEGYSSAKPDEPLRRELCEEAIRLTQILCQHPVAARESWALLALMMLHHARVDARSDEEGELLLMEEQDRSLWDQKAIYRGIQCLMRSGNEAPLSRYHIEAAILLEHCSSASYADTDWPTIAELYRALDRVNPSPLHTLNRAIALSQAHGPQAGLELLGSCTPPTWLARYYLWDATLGVLHRRAGQAAKAREHFQRALQSAPTDTERRRIRGWLETTDRA